MAKEIRSVVRIGMNYTEVVGGVSEVNRRMKLLDSEFRKTQESAKQFGTSVDELKNKQEYLTQKITLQTSKVKDMKAEYEKIKKEKGENSKEAEKYATSLNYAERALIQMQGELKTTAEKLTEQVTKFQELRTKLGEYGESAKKVAEDTGKVGDAFVKMSVPLMAFSAGAGKMAMSFETAMAKVSTMVDTNEVDMDQLGQTVQDLSKTFGKSTGEIATGMYNALSAGVDIAKVSDFLVVSNKMAVGALTETNTAVEGLTNILNSYGMATEDAIKVSDQLFNMQRYGKISVEEFAQQAGRVAPLFAALGGTTEELATTLAVLTKNGIKSRQAVTGLSAIVSGIVKPSEAATKAADELGISFSVNSLKTKGFSQFMHELMRNTGGSEAKINELFGSTEAFNAVAVLASKQGGKDFNNILKIMQNEAGATDEAFEKMADTTQHKLNVAIANLKTSLETAGAAILPILDTVLKILTPIFTLIGSMNPLMVQSIALLGMFLLTTGTILKTISSGLGTFAGLTTGLAGFNITAMKTTLIVMGVVAALIALLTLIAVLSNKTSDLERATGSIGQSVGNITGQVNGAMKPGNIPRYAKVNGSHRTGLPRVPRDGYVAELHLDEEVLRADDPRNQNNNKGSGDTFQLNVNMNEIDDVYKLVKVFEEFKQVKRGGFVYD